MANFNKSFIDFSSGETDKKNIALNVNTQAAKGCSHLENMFLTKTRGLQRRTGTLKIETTKYPVDPENQSVRLISMFIGKGLSFVGMMYVVDTTGWDSGMITDLADDSGSGIAPADAKALVIDWFKSDGFDDIYFNSVVLYLDKEVPLSSAYYRVWPKTLNNDWVDLYGFNIAPFQSYAVITHNTGSVEPFVFFYNSDSDGLGTPKIDWFQHRIGLTMTNRDYWPKIDVGNAFAVPFEQANLNPNTALRLERLGDTEVKVIAQWYNTSTSAYGTWSTTNNTGDPVPKPHPLSKRIDYLRVTILNNSYILKYKGSEVSAGVYQYVDDLTAYDVHKFDMVIDAPDTAKLWTVLNTAQTTSNFNLESFNITDGYPDNAMFFDQRLIFTRDGRIFNSNVGNAFYFNQYRFPQASLVESFVYTPLVGSAALRSLPLIIQYSGTKIASDPFDFTPLSEALVDVSWINKSENIEFGTYSEINNISGLEDSMYSFDSIKSLLGAKYGSKKAISIKASNDTIFIDGSNKGIRNYFYNGQIRTYVSNDLNELNPSIIEHMMNDMVNGDDLDIVELSYDQDNQNILAIVKPTQSMIGITYDRLANKMAWFRMTIGGESGNDVPVYSSAFLRNDKSDSYCYIATQRDGEFWLEKFAKRYNKEEMNPFHIFGGAVTTEDLPYYLDFSTGFVGPTSSTWNIGMDYADKVVTVLADGFWISNVSVDSSGVIELDREIRTLVVGFPYKSKFRTLDLEPQLGSEIGSTLHWFKAINYVHLRLNKSYGGFICTHNLDDLEKLPYDNDRMIVDDSLKLFSGELVIHIVQESSPENSVYIESDAPYPFELLAMTVKGESNER